MEITRRLVLYEKDDTILQIYGSYNEPLFVLSELCRVINRTIGVQQDRIIDHVNASCKKLLRIVDCNQEFVFLTYNGFKELIDNTQGFEGLNELFNSVSQEIEFDRRLQLALKEKDEELCMLRGKMYEEIEKTGHVYVIRTDSLNMYKVGKTNDLKKRIRGLQTGNASDIEVLLDFRTNNSHLLESAVHDILAKYRCNGNREFFNCDPEYIKLIVRIVGTTLDTLKSSYKHISSELLIEHLQQNLDTVINTTRKNEANQKVYMRDDKAVDNFQSWLDKNIESGGDDDGLKLKDICEIYSGKTSIHSSLSTMYRKEIENHIRSKYTDIKSRYSVVKVNGKSYKGWKGLRFKNGLDKNLQNQ